MEPDAPQLLSALVSAGAAAHVVSGGLESEVAGALAAHGIAGFFASINGSPRTKDEILLDLTSRSARASDGVFVGDSRLDMEVAARFGLRRIFVTQWSEFEDWPLYVAEHDDILVVPNLQHLSRSIGSVDSGS
jgi:phosphoglycolate phosphatase-like HAD superfamily hydrolase